MALSDTVPKRTGYGDVLSMFAVILSIAVGLQAYAGLTELADLRAHGIVTEGNWADQYTDPNDGKQYVIYYFKVGYRTFRNRQQAPEDVPYTNGGTVSVVYSPDNPELSRIARTEGVQNTHIFVLSVSAISATLALQYLFAYYTRRSAWVLLLVVFVRRVATGNQPYRPQLSQEDIQRQTAEREIRKRRFWRDIKRGILVGLSIFAIVLVVVLRDYVQNARLRAKYEARANRIAAEAVVQEFNGVKMVLVPAGCFDMGDQGRSRRQCFDEPFWIDQYEVTNEQYGSTGCGNTSSQPTQPRTCVSWVDARDFCESRGA
jgi:hypothetical protein